VKNKIKEKEIVSVEKSKKALNGFKEFAMKGNVVDMAVGVIIGGAFSKIVTSFVNDIIMPSLSIITGKMDFTNLFISLDGKAYATLEQAKAAGASTINYGLLLTTVMDFFIVALSIYLVVSQIQKLTKKKEEEPKPKTTKTCPHCMSEININATKCPFCISDIKSKNS